MFWLALLTALHDVITDPHIPMPNQVREEIRRIANFRWKEMMGDPLVERFGPDEHEKKLADGFASRDVYLTGFVLDPRKLLLIHLVTRASQ